MVWGLGHRLEGSKLKHLGFRDWGLGCVFRVQAGGWYRCCDLSGIVFFLFLWQALEVLRFAFDEHFGCKAKVKQPTVLTSC